MSILLPTPRFAPAKFSVGLPLDLNNDGVTDFELINYIYIRETCGRELGAPPVRGDQVVGSGTYAFARVTGVAVGPERVPSHIAPMAL